MKRAVIKHSILLKPDISEEKIIKPHRHKRTRIKTNVQGEGEFLLPVHILLTPRESLAVLPPERHLLLSGGRASDKQMADFLPSRVRGLQGRSHAHALESVLPLILAAIY